MALHLAASGLGSVKQTLKAMRGLALAGKADPRVRALAQEIVRYAPADDAGAARAVQAWVQQHVKYDPDPEDVEVLQEPMVTVPAEFGGQWGAGDCDDQAILVASLL